MSDNMSEQEQENTEQQRLPSEPPEWPEVKRQYQPPSRAEREQGGDDDE
jgi:hypothetical protein